jgi:uncharacterized membrane protein HdeD (DUF308 family)
VVKRYAHYLLPALAVVALYTGVSYLGTGITALRAGNYTVGVLLLLFGVAGLVLGVSLWRAWRTFAKGVIAGGTEPQQTSPPSDLKE